jgi:hypothetical protein
VRVVVVDAVVVLEQDEEVVPVAAPGVLLEQPKDLSMVRMKDCLQGLLMVQTLVRLSVQQAL